MLNVKYGGKLRGPRLRMSLVTVFDCSLKSVSANARSSWWSSSLISLAAAPWFSARMVHHYRLVAQNMWARTFSSAPRLHDCLHSELI